MMTARTASVTTQRFWLETILREFGLVMAGSLLIALCARIQVPGLIPFTMQTFAVVLIAGLFGGARGTAAAMAYLLEGAAGLPVFAQGSAGLAYFTGPTGGYLLGFVPAAYVVGWLCARSGFRGAWGMTIAFLVGHILILAIGVAWLSVLSGFQVAMAVGWTPFLVTAVLKSLLAVAAVRGLGRFVGPAIQP